LGRGLGRSFVVTGGERKSRGKGRWEIGKKKLDCVESRVEVRLSVIKGHHVPDAPVLFLAGGKKGTQKGPIGQLGRAEKAATH